MDSIHHHTRTPSSSFDLRIKSSTGGSISRHSLEQILQRDKADNGNFGNDSGIIEAKPRFGNYSILSNRIKTFYSWPTCKTQKTKDMSMAGFVYSGRDDIVQCFFCGVSLKDWPKNACPWEQHVIANPQCGHVKLCKGINYIERITRQKNSQHIFDDSNDVIDMVQVAMQRNPVAVEAAREFCDDEDKLRQAIKILMKTNKSSSFTAEKLIRIVTDEEAYNENNSECKTDDVIGEHYTLDEANGLETDAGDSDVEKDDEELSLKLHDSVNCTICYNAIRSVITLPCAHLVCCSQCVSALKECAICRVEIKGTVRAIMAS
ncbi:Baculoviral IAP [Mactra antiquata]